MAAYAKLNERISQRATSGFARICTGKLNGSGAANDSALLASQGAF
jgi:hypothetical protein